MQINQEVKEEIYDIIMKILKNGGEAVVRKRSKNGEKYIEIVEQKFESRQKFQL